METIATLERVKEIYSEIQKYGQRPSADRIIARLGGGSKTTVLGHMRTIADEEARATGAADIPLEILSGLAVAMARKLWLEAKTMSNAGYDSKIQTLLALQNGLFDDLKEAAAAEEALEDELKTARERIAVLEVELLARADADQHLATIAKMLTAKAADRQTPIMELLRLLETGKPRNRAEVLARMVELGHTAKQARTARDHAVKSKYVVEAPVAGAGAELVITDVGRGRLPGFRRRA